MSATPNGAAPEDLIAFVERDIGKTLSEDARFLLRLAVNLGIARANERNISLGVCASWINLLGAALLARDPTSRWLQEKRDAFDVDEVLPGSPARARAIQLAAGQKDASNDLPGGDRPAFLSTSAIDQLKTAASIVAPALGDPPTASAGTLQALHIIASLILLPVGDHGTEAAVGRGDAQNRSDIQNHMARWLADNAFAFDSAWRDKGLASYLQGAETIFSRMRPELAVAAGINPKESFNDWMGRFQEWVPPYSPYNLSMVQWRASGPLGRILDGRFAPNAGSYPPEWTPFLDLLGEAVGPSWINDVPSEGGALAGRGLSLIERALALTRLVSRPDDVMRSSDLYHLIGAVFAPPEAALPPAFEPFPTFRPDLPPNARQTLRRRFLVLVAQHPRGSERLSVWADVILGERLVTARIPTDLGPSEDLLDFSRYAKAFASVIADRAVSPPLAIGLFGVWGSGKSSMIDMISSALADIDIRASLDEELRFCRGIVRITFNAWHYAETNLWASIFVRVLEEMAHHLRPTATPEQRDDRDLSLLALVNAQKEKQAADTELAGAELTVARVAQEAAKVEQDLTAARQAEAEAEATQAKAVAAAQADEATRFNALEIAGDATALLLSIGRLPLEDLAGDDGKKLADALKEQREQISKVTKSFKEMSAPLKRLQLILGWERPLLLYLIVVAAVAIPVALFIWLAVQSGLLAGIAASALSGIAIMTGALTTLAPLWARGREAIARAPAIMTKLADAAERVKLRAEERQEAAEKAKTASEAAATEKARQDTATAFARAKSTEEQAAAAELAVATARAKVEAARQAVIAAEARIADMAPERLLSRFVEDRAASEDYGRQLGLPTRIRKDLDTLRGYLVTLTNASTAVRHADRIVLFIDDLDRCAPPVVVKVLEAVQILLASDLFVVVVGVDVRWLTKSLATHHAGQFRDKQILNPEDFLEKIFQVPFWIPGMSVAGSQAVVKNALPQVREKETGGTASEAGTPAPHASATPGGGSGQGGENSGAPSSEAAPLPTLEPVELTREEHAALLRWGAFAGVTPRRLKRFARSYLILRASLLPAERDAFIAGSEFDTVARLLAFNTADPNYWPSFAAFVSSKAANDWKQSDFGPVWKQLFVETTEPPAPAPAACRSWLAEVERFGFAERSERPSTHQESEPQLPTEGPDP